MKIRSATRRALVAVLLAALAGCTAPAGSTGVPAAEPSGARTIAPSDDAANGICVVRSSLAPSATTPSAIVNRKLVAGVDPSDATMSHWDAQTQQFEGFNIELLLEVARAIWPDANPRDKITFRVVAPGQGAFSMLYPEDPATEPVDIIATSLTATCERAEQVLFSNNYLDSGQTALVRRRGDKPEYAGMEDLGGRRVCAAAQTTSLAAIASYRTADGKRPVPVQATHSIDCLVMLREGQVDAVSTDENILLGFAQMAPDTMLVDQPPRKDRQFCQYHSDDPCPWITDEPHAFAFDKNNTELTRFVNHVLESPRGKAAWQQAHDTWLKDHRDRGKPAPGPVVTTWPPD